MTGDKSIGCNERLQHQAEARSGKRIINFCYSVVSGCGKTTAYLRLLHFTLF